MKNLILLLLVVAAIWYGWMWVCLQYLPQEEARNFVEELRLGIDNGVLGRSFTYHPPLPPNRLEMPTRGISKEFQVLRKNGPSPTDKDTDRRIEYAVRFRNSEHAPPGRSEESEYRLVQVDRGSYLVPKWEVWEFRPARSRPLREQPK